jgi:prophage regulatory protein
MQVLSPRFIKLPEVERKTGLKRDSVYRLAKLGQFPKPVKVSKWSSAWVESEVDQLIRARIAARDARLQ